MKVAASKMRSVVKEELATLTDAEKKAVGNVEAFAESQIKMVETPWFRYFLTYDPRPALAKVHCPVLALIGEKDLQVPPKENLFEIETALKAAGNEHVTVKVFPGLNHLFQTARTGNVTEYAEIEETIAPSALDMIAGWVATQTKAK